MKSWTRWLAASMAAGVLLTANTALAAVDTSLGVISQDGKLLAKVSSYAGTGEFGDLRGNVSDSAFREPQGLLYSMGKLYVADTENQVIKYLQQDQVKWLSGNNLALDVTGQPIGARLDGTNELSLYNHPTGLAMGANGMLFVADSSSHTIRKVNPSGTSTTWVGTDEAGLKDGSASEARFNSPRDIVVTSDGTAYVADTLNHVIRRITNDGVVTTLTAQSDRTIEVGDGTVELVGDYADGPLAEAKFNEPSSLAVDALGNLYVSDSGNNCIRYINLQAGTVSTVAGSISKDKPYEGSGIELAYAVSGYADGKADQAMFHNPLGITLASDGSVIVADSMNHVIRLVKDGEVLTIAGTAEEYGVRSGIESAAQFYFPADVALSPDGTLFVADSFNNKIRKVDFYQLPKGLPAAGIKVMYNQQRISFDAQPESVQGRTMIPVRAITETLGYKVEYPAKGVVRLSKGTLTIELKIGSNELTRIEGGAKSSSTMDTAPYVKSGRTYVPIRFFAEQTGLDVQWIVKHRTVVLRDPIQ